MSGQHGVLSTLLSLLDNGSTLTPAAAAYASAAVRSQHLLTAAAAQQDPQQQQRLTQQTAKLLAHVSKRAAKSGAPDQVAALQLLATCISCCSAQDLLQQATAWGLQLADTLRQAAAALQPSAEAVAQGPAQGKTSAAAAVPTYQAACSAAMALCKRLQQHIEAPGVRREISAIPGKILPQILVILAAPGISSCHVPALQLLGALLLITPGALRSNVAAVERLLMQLLSSAAASSAPEAEQVLADAAACVGLLPGVSGEAAAWSEAARRVLVQCHEVLDYMLMGLEGSPWDPAARTALQTTSGAAAGGGGGGGGTAGGSSAGSSKQQQQAGAVASTAQLQYPWHHHQQQQQQGGEGGAGSSAGSSGNKLQLRPARLLLGALLTALQCLLRGPFPHAVPLPSAGVMSVAVRLTRVDPAAAVAAGAVPASRSMYQDLLVVQPQLQAAGWLLLQLLVAAGGLQLLPLHGALVRVAAEGLRSISLAPAAAVHTTSPALHSAVYAAAQQVLVCVGYSMAGQLAGEVLSTALAEVYGQVAGQSGQSNTLVTAGDASQRPNKRQRTGGSSQAMDHFDAAHSLAATQPTNPAASMAAAAVEDLQAQAGALQLLQALVEVVGPALAPQLRSSVDATALHVAQTSTDALQQLQQQVYVAGSACNLQGALQQTAPGQGVAVEGWEGPGGQQAAAALPALRALQLASYRLLLASVLSPCGTRPPYLAQSLALFRRARSSSCPQLAAFSCQAALACEALLHPRALTLAAAAATGAVGGLGSSSTGLSGGAAGGSNSVQYLPRPRMWSVVDGAPAAGTPGAAAGAADAQPAAVQHSLQGHSAPQQQQQAQHGMNGHAATGPALVGQQQQQQQQSHVPAGHADITQAAVSQAGALYSSKAPAGDAPVSTAAAQKAAGTANGAAAEAATNGPFQQQQQQKGSSWPVVSHLEVPAALGAHPPGTPLAPTATQRVAAPAEAAAQGPAAAAADIQSQQQPGGRGGAWQGTNDDDQMSSDDSEGPLPDIDSGGEEGDSGSDQ